MDTTLDDFYILLDRENKEIFSEIEAYAYELGYKAKRAKTQDINYVFASNKTKKHIMKFSYKDGKPELKMKYYASKNYSELFHVAVRYVIEEYNYRYTGCYKCGKCKGAPQGYVYHYSDGKSYFRCGGELISLPVISKAVIPEIKQLLNAQHEYYLKIS